MNEDLLNHLDKVKDRVRAYDKKIKEFNLSWVDDGIDSVTEFHNNKDDGA